MMKNYIYTIALAMALVGCQSDSTDSATQPVIDGQGGSLARFTLQGDYLYTVDAFDLNVFNVKDIKNPVSVNKVQIGFEIETLFGYKDYLYIGSRNGMFIYSLKNPEFPQKLSSVEHFTACDPVVANDTHAFVTLHSNTNCGNDINLLEIYDVRNVNKPLLINSRNLTYPKGLGIYGNFLLVCDDEIKVFDISEPETSTLVTSIKREAFDVIIRDDLLIAIGETGLYQYNLSKNDQNSITATALSTLQI